MLYVPTLTEYVLVFFRKLRKEGFILGPHEMTDGMKAIQSIDLVDVEQFKRALQIVICSTKEEQEKFESLFQQYFLFRNKEDLLHFLSEIEKVILDESMIKNVDENTQTDTKDGNEKNEKASTNQTGIGFDEMELENLEDSSEEERSKTMLFTALNRIAKKPKQLRVTIPSYHFSAMEQAAEKVIRQVKLIDSRRKRRVKKGNIVDMRRTFRKSIQTGAYPINPIYVGPVKQKSKFVLLCDSSRSMSTYSRIYLQFAYALMQYTASVEVFLFSTKLRRVTEQFTAHQHGKFPVLHVHENEWEGGTCIGESLYTFTQKNGSYMLDKNTIVLIASDGLDTGDEKYLQRAMQDIYHRSAFVMWFNPLLNINGYEPRAKGMKTALPYIDIFSNAVEADAFSRLSKQIKLRR